MGGSNAPEAMTLDKGHEMSSDSDSDVAVSILRKVILDGDVDVVRHGDATGDIGAKIIGEFYATPEEADLLERLLEEEERERRPDLYEDVA